MEIDVAAESGVTLVRVSGYVDTRASVEFERRLLELLQQGTVLLGIDFTKVDMLTSAGIRVLMMLVKRLGGTDRIALWGLNEEVKMVFTIAGLSGHFHILATQQEALAQLLSAGTGAIASGGEISKMGRLAMRLLGDAGAPPSRPRPAGGSPESVSQMTARVSELLAKHKGKQK
jgi:anti-anti-sigma factor